MKYAYRSFCENEKKKHENKPFEFTQVKQKRVKIKGCNRQMNVEQNEKYN